MRILDLFAGIGGFSLAAHWMGWKTAAFVEWDKDCRHVLQKNFPGVPVYGDIKQFQYEQERDRIGTVDLICGGFPCQPFSSAGKRNGTTDDRYLWPEMLRTIREVGPRWVVGENVAGLITMDGGAVFDEICTSLEDEGYTVEAFVIPACAVGAPHRRDRVWIVAHAESGRRGVGDAENIGAPEREKHPPGDTIGLHASDADQPGLEGYREHGERSRQCFAGPENWQEPWLQVATRLCGKFNGLSNWLDANKQRLIYATSSKTITRQDLRTLREKIQSPEVWENIRRCYQIPEPEFLFTVVRQLEKDSEGQDNIPFEGEAVFENCVRDVQDYETPGSPSYRRRHNEQRRIEYSDTLSELSHEIALATESLLWRWEAETSDRTRRLKQLGNSIVPQVVYEIFKAIKNQNHDS